MKNKKFDFPPRIKKLLIGSVVSWFDNDPLSLNDEMHIRYFFDTKTNANADLLLRKNGLTDVSHFASLPFNWLVEIENVYLMPNRENVEKHHTERTSFNYRGIIYPMGEKFKAKRDAFYMAKNLEFSLVPEDHKNKKFYQQTNFKATVVSI